MFFGLAVGKPPGKIFITPGSLLLIFLKPGVWNFSEYGGCCKLGIVGPMGSRYPYPVPPEHPQIKLKIMTNQMVIPDITKKVLQSNKISKSTAERKSFHFIINSDDSDDRSVGCERVFA
jgi:hypothetical protein